MNRTGTHAIRHVRQALIARSHVTWGQQTSLSNSYSAAFTRRWGSSENTGPKSRTLPSEDYGEADDDDEDETMDESSLQPWKNLLIAPARAAWRVSDPHLPSNIADAMDKILLEGERTPKQLKRAHRKVTKVHTELAEFRERERRRLVNGKYYRGKDAGEEGALVPVYYGYDQTLATLKHRLFPNYAITRRVLEECRSLLGPNQFSPKRILDFGIGCGSASAAAVEMFDDVEWIHGIDPSQPMRDCSEALLNGMASEKRMSPRVTFSTSLSADSTATSGGGSFDLALCAFSATDLPDIGATLAATAILFEKLKPGGVLVMIEPGTPDGFNSIRATRNMLLDCCPPDDPEFEWEERCHIVAPCTHNGQCPMVRHKKDFIKKGKLGHDLPQELNENKDEAGENNGPMYFADNIPEELGDDDFVELSSQPRSVSETEAFNSSFCSFVHLIPGLDSRRGEKFSYLVAQKKIYGRAEDTTDPFEKDNLSALLAKAQAAADQENTEEVMKAFNQAQDLTDRYFDSAEDDLGLELIRGEKKRQEMGRIVRAPIKKKGHVYIDYCTAPGRIIRNRVAKSSSNTAPGLYSAARKSRWGGLWPDTSDKIAK